MTKTESEALFEALCQRLAIECQPIPRAATRTADYRLMVARNEVVAELKQLEPNESDRRNAKRLARAEVVLGSYDPGKRVRQEIIDSRAQLRALAKGRCPGLLVIYNTIDVAPLHTDPMAILIAMYGQLQVLVAVPKVPTERPRVVGSRFGPKRSMTEEHNTTISAVCVLYRNMDAAPGINFYHNAFAALPFDPGWLRSANVRHYGVRDAATHRFEEWVEL